MITMIVDSQYRTIFINDVTPYYKQAGIGPDSIKGTLSTDWISEGGEEWKLAVQKTLKDKTSQTCEIVNVFEEYRSRWRCTMQFLEPNHVIISGVNIPYHLNELSEREWDILKQIAFDKSNAQIATELAISVSTVEKHRNNMRKRLEIQDESQLRLTAWLVLNPDSLHSLP